MTTLRNTGDRRAGSLASLPDALKIHFAQGGICIGSFRNTAIVHWGSRATREPVRALSAVSVELIKQHQRISVVQIIPDSVAMPEDDVRAEMLRLVEAGARSLGCLAYVLGGDGFWASAVRGVITSTTWVYQRPFLARTCTTLEEAVAWLPSHHAERTGVTLEPALLLDVLKRVSSGTAAEHTSQMGPTLKRSSET